MFHLAKPQVNPSVSLGDPYRQGLQGGAASAGRGDRGQPPSLRREHGWQIPFVSPCWSGLPVQKHVSRRRRSGALGVRVVKVEMGLGLRPGPALWWAVNSQLGPVLADDACAGDLPSTALPALSPCRGMGTHVQASWVASRFPFCSGREALERR